MSHHLAVTLSQKRRCFAAPGARDGAGGRAGGEQGRRSPPQPAAARRPRAPSPPSPPVTPVSANSRRPFPLPSREAPALGAPPSPPRQWQWQWQGEARGVRPCWSSAAPVLGSLRGSGRFEPERLAQGGEAPLAARTRREGSHLPPWGPRAVAQEAVILENRRQCWTTIALRLSIVTVNYYARENIPSESQNRKQLINLSERRVISRRVFHIKRVPERERPSSRLLPMMCTDSAGSKMMTS
ncbi:uncharacterized protein LOC134143523 [Rhea pennata]|uniref:uncharacterized protein LOC134143523 n=1 Tax=Rhea pennata TaxID=8795 RepID=UPI002E275D5F